MSDLPMSKEECEQWLSAHRQSTDRVVSQLAIDHSKTLGELYRMRLFIEALQYDAGARKWFITDGDMEARGLRFMVQKPTP